VVICRKFGDLLPGLAQLSLPRLGELQALHCVALSDSTAALVTPRPL
jgi:hypothetical protein